MGSPLWLCELPAPNQRGQLSHLINPASNSPTLGTPGQAASLLLTPIQNKHPRGVGMGAVGTGELADLWIEPEQIQQRSVWCVGKETELLS